MAGLDLAEIAPVLEPITRFALESRFDPAAMTAADIYPNWWNDAFITRDIIPLAKRRMSSSSSDR